MNKTMDEVIAGLPLDQQAEIEAAARILIEEELTLRDLRKAHALTQTQMSQALNMSQDGVSRLERRTDLLLSTLRSYVEAMGGRLKISAEFPDRAPVSITQLGSLSEDGAKRKVPA
jgi:transcriptional regulator with XRE-family HTH domain